jgi:hypothetical protein
MPSITPDHEKTAGVKFFMRFEDVEVLFQKGKDLAQSAVEEVTITGTAADGGSANGEVTFPKWLYLQAISEILKEKNYVPLNSDGTITSRQLGTRPDYSRTWAVT